jgi:hypothetical protein
MKKSFAFFVWLFIFTLPTGTESFGQLEKVIVEKYYVSDAKDSTDLDGGKLPEGSVTYRIYVDLKPGSKLLQVYGDNNHAIIFKSTKPFFNNIDGQTYAKDIKKSKYNQNTVALDTYLTLGQTASPLSGKTNFGVLKHQDRDGSFIGGTNNDGGSASVNGGLLVNKDPSAGLELTKSDGMDTMQAVPNNWSFFGLKNFVTGIDSTMFGSVVTKTNFSSRNMFLKNSGVRGVNADSNQVLIAQLTTKGSLSFEINIEVEEPQNGTFVKVKYVANDSVLLSGEKISRYMKYPFPAPVCGCKDDSYVEFNGNLECADNAKFCKTKIVFGCNDPMACNYDASVTSPLPSLCCYVGYCNGRDISLVCPKIRASNFYVSFHPNPVENDLSLSVIGGVETDIHIKIINANGTVVYDHTYTGSMHLLNQLIPLQSSPSGIYFMHVEYNGEVSRKLFIKQ